MKMISWNVNGLRACMNKGFASFFQLENPDIFAIQETKMKEEQKEFHFDGYYEFWNSADKAGYSGTLIYTKKQPISVVYGIDGDGYNDEGRIITLEFDLFYFVTVYTPNAKRDLLRLDYRMKFEDRFRDYLVRLDQKKPVILCGDLNVAHREMDLANPKSNERNAGFTIEERTKFQQLLDSGFSDTYRSLYPDRIQYSWWSYMFQSRQKNIGWRIDYFVVSNRIMNQVTNSTIHEQITGSDHCPVSISIHF